MRRVAARRAGEVGWAHLFERHQLRRLLHHRRLHVGGDDLSSRVQIGPSGCCVAARATEAQHEGGRNCAELRTAHQQLQVFTPWSLVEILAPGTKLCGLWQRGGQERKQTHVCTYVAR